MGPAIEHDSLAELSTAVAAYLNLMAASADCLEQTYPDVGSVYRQRIHRLRSRVSFHATREAIKDSAETMQVELKDYAGVANRVLTQRSVELTRGILALGDMIENLAQRQQLFGDCLRQLAVQVENGGAGGHAASLRLLVDAMGDESDALVSQMRRQMIELDQRLAGTASTDVITGLINRREMDRQIEAHKLHGSEFTLLHFELSGPMSDQVRRMAAGRLVTKFRHPEWIARWANNEFAVLFLGNPEIAQARAAEAVSCIEGRYKLENGETVLVSARSTTLLQPELVTQ